MIFALSTFPPCTWSSSAFFRNYSDKEIADLSGHWLLTVFCVDIFLLHSSLWLQLGTGSSIFQFSFQSRFLFYLVAFQIFILVLLQAVPSFLLFSSISIKCNVFIYAVQLFNGSMMTGLLNSSIWSAWIWKTFCKGCLMGVVNLLCNLLRSYGRRQDAMMHDTWVW